MHCKKPCPPYLANHPVPDATHYLPVLSIGYQVEVVGELHRLGQLLQDIDAEALATELGVGVCRPISPGSKALSRLVYTHRYFPETGDAAANRSGPTFAWREGTWSSPGATKPHPTALHLR